MGSWKAVQDETINSTADLKAPKQKVSREGGKRPNTNRKPEMRSEEWASGTNTNHNGMRSQEEESGTNTNRNYQAESAPPQVAGPGDALVG